MDTTDEPASLIDWNTPIANTVCKPLIPLPLFNGNFEINEDNPFDDVERQIHDVFSPNVSVVADNRDTYFMDSLIGKMEKMRLNNTSVLEMSSARNKEVTIGKDDSNSERSLLTTSMHVSTTNSSPRNLSNLFQVQSGVTNLMNPVLEDVHSKNQSTSNSEDKLISLSQEDASKDKVFNDGFVASTTDESRSSSSSKLFSSSEISRYCDEFLLSQSFEDIRSIVPCWEGITFYFSSDEENENVSSFKEYSESSQTSLSRKHAPSQVKKMRKLRSPLVLQEPNIRVKKTNHLTKQGPLKAVVPMAIMKVPVATIKGVSRKNSKNLSSINKNSMSPLTMSRRSAPVATSTPQSVKGTSLNSSLSTPVKCSNTIKTMQSRAPSPDSTSDSRYTSRPRNGIQSKLTKRRRIPCSPVSSSTNLSFPRPAPKTVKSMKNSSFSELSKGTIMKPRNIHNKENLSPFQI